MNFTITSPDISIFPKTIEAIQGDFEACADVGAGGASQASKYDIYFTKVEETTSITT
jgi:hypothetical protein